MLATWHLRARSSIMCKNRRSCLLKTSYFSVKLTSCATTQHCELMRVEALTNGLMRLSAGAARACAQREVPNPLLHVHRLREPAQTLPGAQPVQAGHSRGEGGRRKCKYISFLLNPPTARRVPTTTETINPNPMLTSVFHPCRPGPSLPPPRLPSAVCPTPYHPF